MGKSCREPDLDELLQDSAMRLLLASDKVDEAALRTLLDTVLRTRPAAAPRPSPACCRA